MAEIRDSTIGFVGLGAMGGRMVKRLLGAGRQVIGYNRTKVKAGEFLEQGMGWRESPRAVAESADVTITMITDTDALAAVTGGADGILAGLGPGKVYVDMSTVSPVYSRDLAAKVAEKGASMLDAPVSGSIITLEAGKLSIMVGGPRETYERVKPILLDIGPTTTYLGPNGAAATMKLAVNIGICVQMVIFSEGVVMAEKAGVSRDTAVETYLKSVVASPALGYRAPLVLEMPDEALFDINFLQKDIILALEAGRELQSPLPTTAAANEILNAARAMGWGDKDFAVIFDVIGRMAGLEDRV
jgi:3-hydroxyisobutyrate dehydrogenase-like beta-hydroxyacid dehydrogenase